jgi:hypothetical protein
MSSPRQAYRKLSSWHSLFNGAVLFLDEHCLISVRSSGYEERVKRLYFKDIQAIVVSKSRRFGVSRRVIFVSLLLVLTLFYASRFAPASPYSRLFSTARGAFEVALVLGWLYISIAASCRCRVYTAVSQEELLSIRRPWTASKLLARLTPMIEAAQGTLPAGWHESLASDRPFVLAQAALKEDREASAEEVTRSRTRRFWASSLLVGSLLLSVVLNAWQLEPTRALPNWIAYTLMLLEVAGAVWVLIQNRGVDVSLQRLGAAVLIFVGLVFYAQTAIAAFAAAQAKRPLQAEELRATPVHRSFLKFYVGGSAILGILGAFLILAGPTPRRPGVLVE